ncbi:hypothetical protein CEXT_65531, partial [Caerostris extrusa]
NKKGSYTIADIDGRARRWTASPTDTASRATVHLPTSPEPLPAPRPQPSSPALRRTVAPVVNHVTPASCWTRCLLFRPIGRRRPQPTVA